MVDNPEFGAMQTASSLCRLDVVSHSKRKGIISYGLQSDNTGVYLMPTCLPQHRFICNCELLDSNLTQTQIFKS
jgi:hypothetical protein